MAQKAVEVGCEILQGKKLDQNTVLIPPTLVIRDSVKDYKGWTSK